MRSEAQPSASGGRRARENPWMASFEATQGRERFSERRRPGPWPRGAGVPHRAGVHRWRLTRCWKRSSPRSRRPGRGHRTADPKSGKGGIRAWPESLPARRSHGSPGPFPLAHAWLDTACPPRSPHASATGRFPTASRFDSIREVRCAWGVPWKDEVCERKGKRTAADAAAGELGKRRVDWEGGSAAAVPRAARGRAPFGPLAVGQSVDLSGHLALCLRHRHSATGAALVKNDHANLYRSRPRSRVLLHVQGTAVPLRGSTLQRAFSLASERAARPSGHARAAWARRGDRRAAVVPARAMSSGWRGARGAGQGGSSCGDGRRTGRRRMASSCRGGSPPASPCPRHSALLQPLQPCRSLVGEPFSTCARSGLREHGPAGIGPEAVCPRSGSRQRKNRISSQKRNPPRDRGGSIRRS